MRHVVVGPANSVINVVELDPRSEAGAGEGSAWSAPDECIVIASETGNIGDTFDPRSAAGAGGAAFVPPASRQPPLRRLVRRSVIIDRLQAAGKLEAARAVLDTADLYTRERWNAREAIYADDETAIALLAAIGADPASILG